MSRLPNPRKVKALSTYTYEEASDALGVAVVTVRSWVQSGALTAMTSTRPHLMRGSDIRDFLVSRRNKQKSTLQLGEFYCFSCKAVRKPLGDMVDCLPNSATSIRLNALCCACETQMNRFVPPHEIPQWQQIMDLGSKDVDDA